MENKKDIGKLFRSKLDTLDKSPNEKLWLSIQAELEEKKKKRRVIPFWLIASGTAVAVLLLIGPLTKTFWQLPFQINSSVEKQNNIKSDGNAKSENNYKKNAEENVSANGIVLKTIVSDENTKSNIFSASKAENKKNKSQTKTKYLNSKKHKTVITKHQITLVKIISDSILNSANTNQTTDLTAKNFDKNNDSLFNDEKKTDSLKEKSKEKKEVKLLAEKKVDSIKKPYSNLYIFAHITPTAYDYFSKKSVIDDRLNDNQTLAEIEYNFGVYVGFQASEKLNFRIGFNKTSLSLKTKNVQLISSNTDSEISGYFHNIDYAKPITNAQLASNFNDSIVDLTQKLSYFEIPIEVKYKIFNTRIGIEAIAGFSTLYLSKNHVTAKANGSSMNLGSLSSVKKLNFSGNIGIGFNYKLARNFQLNVEPMFKYYLTTSQNPKPYSLNLQTGLQYTFSKK